MRLIGMLDSPYVRRVAVSARLMGLSFQHEPISVFRGFEAFAAINPVVKAPTLVADDGTVLLDSTLILDHLESLAAPGRSLIPQDPKDRLRALRVVGLALAACEKSVQIVYEHKLRPHEKQHGPWLDRVTGQLHAAYRLLADEVGNGEAWLFADRPLQADATTAVAWRFTQLMIPEIVPATDHPGLARLSARAEALPEFLATPIE